MILKLVFGELHSQGAETEGGSARGSSLTELQMNIMILWFYECSGSALCCAIAYHGMFRTLGNYQPS